MNIKRKFVVLIKASRSVPVLGVYLYFPDWTAIIRAPLIFLFSISGLSNFLKKGNYSKRKIPSYSQNAKSKNMMSYAEVQIDGQR